MRLSSEQQQVVGSLRHPPVYAAAQPMWYEAKALEIAAALLYQPLPGEELFCQRVKRLNRERVQKVRAILKESLAAPPSLEVLGRRVGCSPFHLSRVFAQETGKTITGCLRELRLERAAQLLGSGECNVTEAALEVGYNSLSHFTVAFRETFGCCPGLYPLKARHRDLRPAPSRVLLKQKHGPDADLCGAGAQCRKPPLINSKPPGADFSAPAILAAMKLRTRDFMRMLANAVRRHFCPHHGPGG